MAAKIQKHLWSCIQGLVPRCEEDPNGLYDSEAECLASCVSLRPLAQHLAIKEGPWIAKLPALSKAAATHYGTMSRNLAEQEEKQAAEWLGLWYAAQEPNIVKRVRVVQSLTWEPQYEEYYEVQVNVNPAKLMKLISAIKNSKYCGMLASNALLNLIDLAQGNVEAFLSAYDAYKTVLTALAERKCHGTQYFKVLFKALSAGNADLVRHMLNLGFANEIRRLKRPYEDVDSLILHPILSSRNVLQGELYKILAEHKIGYSEPWVSQAVLDLLQHSAENGLYYLAELGYLNDPRIAKDKILAQLSEYIQGGSEDGWMSLVLDIFFGTPFFANNLPDLVRLYDLMIATRPNTRQSMGPGERARVERDAYNLSADRIRQYLRDQIASS